MKLLIICFIITITNAKAQDSSELEIARQLSMEDTRQAAVAAITALGNQKISLLLSWTVAPPSHVDKTQLYIGLADVFGKLRTKEAIPFLVENIDLRRWPDVNTWMKAPTVVEQRLPAVGALINIGRDSSSSLMEAYWRSTKAEERLAIIFTVSRIGDPAARDFYVSVLSYINSERRLADEALRRLESRP